MARRKAQKNNLHILTFPIFSTEWFFFLVMFPLSSSFNVTSALSCLLKWRGDARRRLSQLS